MKLLFIGCGDIGSRHIQAASNLSNVDEMYIVDPSNSSIAMTKDRVINSNDIKITWSNKINQNYKDVDLCIISTRSDSRANNLKEVHKKLRIKRFIIEKLASNSLESLLELENYVRQNKIKVWVNCKTRTYKVYKKIKHILNDDINNGKFSMEYFGGNHGMLTNGIHALDLFVFIDNSKHLKKQFINLDDELFETKRNTFDINGSVIGKSNNDNKFSIDYNSNFHPSDLYVFRGLNSCFVVDHLSKKLLISEKSKSWEWTMKNINENWMISKMSIHIIDQILETDSSELPLLHETIPSHQFLFESVTKDFMSKLDLTSPELPIA